MTSRAEQKVSTREAILEAARVEFEASGFDGAAIRKIADRAGVSVGTVMNQGDKRELLHAALFEDLRRVLDDALGVVRAADGADVDRTLNGLAAAVFAHYEVRPGLSRAMLKESFFADEPWAERFAGQTSATHLAVAALLLRGKSVGGVAADVDVDVAAAAWLSFFYFSLIGLVKGHGPSPLRTMRAMTRQHLRLEGRSR